MFTDTAREDIKQKAQNSKNIIRMLYFDAGDLLRSWTSSLKAGQAAGLSNQMLFVYPKVTKYIFLGGIYNLY